MRKLKWLMGLGVLCAAVSVQAQGVLVIADIDDTLKVSHVLSSWDSVNQAPEVNNPFWQMPELLQALARNGAQFAYVSTAPEVIMGSFHRSFLAKNRFPKGEVDLAPLTGKVDFKLRAIRAILNKQKPQIVIALGDNSDHDPIVYETLRTEFPEIRFLTYIRFDYSPAYAVRTEAGQTPFVTAGEVALSLASAEPTLLSQNDVETLVHNSLRRPGLFWDFEEYQWPGSILGLPGWVDCSGYRADLTTYAAQVPEAQTLQSKIDQRCAPGFN